jgi:hypothetical protein
VRFAVADICLVPGVDWWFEGVSWTLHGLGTFGLCAALNHQRRYRSAAIVDDEHRETDPLLRRYSKVKRAFSLLDALFLLVLCAYIALAWLQLHDHDLKWVFFGAFVAQRLPALILTVVIVFFSSPASTVVASGTVTDEPASYIGPSRKAKTMLLLAAVFSVFGDVPLSFWSFILGQGCVFWIASWVDFLHILYVIGLVLYFSFVRQEYLRLMEEAIWTNVSKFQATFNFSKF